MLVQLLERHPVLEDTEDTSPRTFFSEIIASVSDAHFTRDGRYIVSRDYLTLKVWDINMESRPVKTINIHDYLRARLCDLYESDRIFDKFELAISPTGTHYATGSYSNMFHVYDRSGKSDTCIELSKNASESVSPSRTPSRGAAPPKSMKVPRKREHDGLDFEKVVLHLDWHPTRDMVAVAGLNKLYLYSV
jgi:serine/threonine-protein phosphatase 2A regulatory subunit B